MSTPGRATPASLGHYRIIEQIGAGGMGEVYRAHDERLDRDVAVKVLPTGAVADEASSRRFLQEARALAKLNHPNIANVYDFDTQRGVDFLVMEYISGTTLSDETARGQMPEAELLKIGVQLSEGIAAAHGQNVIHRDLKPSNLRLTPDGRLKILDFGLAKLLRPAAVDVTASVGETHALSGTVPYMAPEQLRGEPVDARTDIYGLGVVLYELATGRRPFRYELTPRLTDAILHEQPIPPSEINQRVSPELERIILKCLKKRPEDRYQTASEVAIDLRHLSAPVTRQVPPRGRRWWLVAVAAATLVILALLAFELNMGGMRDRWFRGGSPQIRSIAVLPLENLSHDPEREYFADGMTEELIANLAKISTLRVISRTSVMQYKGTKKTLPQIADELDVDGIVEGSVLREGNQVRITAQLISARPERHLWSNSYTRELREVLALQGEVARAIASEIRVSVTPDEQARLLRTRAVNPEAHEAYLKGRHALSSATGSPREDLLRAVQLDPEYAVAYAALAEMYAFTLPASENMPKARAAARRALELDESLAEGHAVLGLVHMYWDWDWAGADREFHRAMELDPGSAIVRDRYAILCWAMGRLDEAIAVSQAAQKLDPLGIVVNTDLGRSYLFARQYDRAIEQFKKTIEIDPRNPMSHMFLSFAYEQKGLYPEAVAEFVKSRALGNDPAFAEAMKKAYDQGGFPAYLLALAERWAKLYVPSNRAQPYSVALTYARLGQKDKAFEWLERSFRERTRALVYLRFEPQLDSLRPDPRFHSLVQRMNFPP